VHIVGEKGKLMELALCVSQAKKLLEIDIPSEEKSANG